jgi:hypothetical protein
LNLFFTKADQRTRTEADRDVPNDCFIKITDAKKAAEMDEMKRSFWSTLGYDTTMTEFETGNNLDVSLDQMPNEA